MENRKGSGIFLGVVSVATLVVAIIGATFAYFSASVEGNGTVNLTAYEFNASVSVSQVSPTSAASLIPLEATKVIPNAATPNNTNLLYAMNVAANKCIDDAGYQVCAVYKAVFTNNGSESLTLNGTLTTAKNDVRTSASEADIRDGKATGFTNLKFNHLELSGSTYTLSGSAIDVSDDLNGTVPIGEVTVPAGTPVEKYFVVYLNEAGEDNNPEMGASFEGELTFTNKTGGQQLTGTFTVSGE